MTFSREDTVLVVSGGAVGNEISWRLVPEAGYVIAADSGISLAYTLGLTINDAVGDFDSATSADKQLVQSHRGEVHEFEEAKDSTDLEIALAAAATRRPRRIVVLGGAGGRIDHLLTSTLLLASPAWNGVDTAGIQVEAIFGANKITVVREHSTLSADRKGELLTLMAVGGTATGITTAGLHYKLTNHDLHWASSLGVSNEFTELRASVRVRSGTLLAIQSGVLGRHFLHGIGPSDSTR